MHAFEALKNRIEGILYKIEQESMKDKINMKKDEWYQLEQYCLHQEALSGGCIITVMYCIENQGV